MYMECKTSFDQNQILIKSNRFNPKYLRSYLGAFNEVHACMHASSRVRVAGFLGVSLRKKERNMREKVLP